MSTADAEPIPKPFLKSWMFQRISLPKKIRFTNKARILKSQERYHKLNYFVHLAFTFFNVDRFPWSTFKITTTAMQVYFKLFNRLKISGKEHIPNTGCIFYVNHPGSLDPLIFLASVRKPVGLFVQYDNYWLLKKMERFYGLINKDWILGDEKLRSRHNIRDVLVEKMVRNIIAKNAYFAIWPEGFLAETKDEKVVQGFSSVVRAYSVINSQKDLIPFVPVLLKGSGCYHFRKNPGLKPTFDKVSIEFLPSYFVPRDWLRSPEDGGKSQREISDHMMHILARAKGQKTFAPNPQLEKRKRHYQQKMHPNKP